MEGQDPNVFRIAGHFRYDIVSRCLAVNHFIKVMTIIITMLTVAKTSCSDPFVSWLCSYLLSLLMGRIYLNNLRWCLCGIICLSWNCMLYAVGLGYLWDNVICHPYSDIMYVLTLVDLACVFSGVMVAICLISWIFNNINYNDGLTIAEINNIPTRPYNSATDTDQPSCVICLDDYNDTSRVRELPCGHIYHVDCIDGWLALHMTCPVCRRSVIIDNVV